MADGMGAIPIEGGHCRPRGRRTRTPCPWWGPSTTGTRRSTRSAPRATGIGTGRCREAHAGHEYKFQIRNGQNELLRIDPYARQVTSSVGNGVIYDHGAFDWQGDDFASPPTTIS